MKVSTARFGEISIADEKIIAFKDGIPSFEECRDFALITTEETEPFLWLQSLDMPEIALAVINPFRLFPDYSPRVPEAALADIGSPRDEDVLLLTVAVIPREPESMTTNLVSPILINAQANLGKQVIIDGGDYQIRQPIYDLVKNILLEQSDAEETGGTADAGTDQKA
ncbi:MAG: flagellar assembly protein FliW [Oscillospiraceae bacterium]|jgi:flagellar assembly factor FliW|nr:flagellar assembly protein FliW [Oscillospiraceae bacterium]